MFQGRDRSSRWSTRGVEKITKCFSVTNLIQKSFQGVKDASIFQARKCKSLILRGLIYSACEMGHLIVLQIVPS